ncbi:YCF48-related protein [Acidobacteria bacterium AH-259-O06]|nr:YCF48-related protein [Acidobacteria bacterium AH-259-O06]
MLVVGISPRRALAQEAAPAQLEFSVRAPLASRSLLLDGVSVDGLMVAVGERGHILLSENQGQSWRQANVPTQATLTGVFFHDKNLGWAVGHDAIILRTKDGGQNWERLYYAPEQERPFLDVWFRDAKNGFAIGAYGLFLMTADGGDTWSAHEIGPQDDSSEEDDDLGEGYDFHLNHIARSGTGRLYIAAEAGTIYRSDDDGKTWVSLPSPYPGSFFGTLPLENDSLLLFGLRGHLFRSDDAGQTWQEMETATEAMLTDGLRLSDGTIIVAGLGGTLLVSQNQGRSFTLRQQADRQGIATVLQAEDGTLIVMGEFGVRKLPPNEYEVEENPNFP